MNLKDGLQKDGMKLYNEEGPSNKKHAVENRLFQKPTQNNLNHVYGFWEESGSDNENIEDIVKGENKKNSNEQGYTNMDDEKEGKQANLLDKEKPRNHHDIPRKKEKMRKLWLPRKWHCQILGKHFYR